MPMTEGEARAKVLGALAGQVLTQRVKWPRPYASDGPELYWCFRLLSRGDRPRVGGDHYVAVHRVTGAIQLYDTGE